MESKDTSKRLAIIGCVFAAVLLLLYLASRYDISIRKRSPELGSKQGSPPTSISEEPGRKDTRVAVGGGTREGSLGQPAQSAQESELSTEQLFETATPSVALIEVFDEGGRKSGLGSAFLVSPDGSAVTNYHVIRGASRAVARFQDGRSFPVIGVIGYDSDRDVAVVKLGGTHTPSLALGDSDQIRVGQKVVAIGSPLGLQNTVSEGIVSGIRGGVIQMTTPISPGSSGGPLLEKHGKVIGVAVVTLRQGQNLNFAVPINWAKAQMGGGPIRSLQHVADENTIMDYLIDGSLSVPAGQTKIWKITINPNVMSNARLQGTFRSVGGVGGNIRAVVYRGQDVLFDSGRVQSDEMDVPLSEGEYTFALNNTGSVMFSRQVTARVGVRYVK